MAPETQFAQNQEVTIAYQVFGDGPSDLFIIPGWLSNLDIFWEEPSVARLFLALVRFNRVIIIDRRGTGLSDRVTPATLETQMDDVTAVMDAANSKSATLLGYSEGAQMCTLFAATYPERITSLIVIGGSAKTVKSDDYPLGPDRADVEYWFTQVEKGRGGAFLDRHGLPPLRDLPNEPWHRWRGRFRTQGARHGSPARSRRLGHATRPQRQSQCADNDDRLARR